MHKATIDEKGVSLDGHPLQCVRSLNLDIREGESEATLSLVMDVTILSRGDYQTGGEKSEI